MVARRLGRAAEKARRQPADHPLRRTGRAIESPRQARRARHREALTRSRRRVDLDQLSDAHLRAPGRMDAAARLRLHARRRRVRHRLHRHFEKAHRDEWRAPRLTATFGDSSFYMDPTTPALQQAVATVTFSQPVSRDEVLRCLSVTNVSGAPLFAPGGKPQVIADGKIRCAFSSDRRRSSRAKRRISSASISQHA